VILYVGNIDGSASPTWYPLYDRLTSFYENNNISVGFSFFPVTIDSSDQSFSDIFKRMYLADNIELFQKGFTMNATEHEMDSLSFDEQKSIIKAGQYYYIDRMKEILNSTSIGIPVTYVAPFTKFTTITRRAIEELGFRTNFGLYYDGALGPVEGTTTLDSMQYGVSFSVSGSAGRNTVFKSPNQIIDELFAYYRGDVSVLRIDGKRVIPLFVHQPDFEDPLINAKIDENKLNIYNQTIQLLMNNPNITLVTPSQVWNLRHPACIPTSIQETFCNRIDDDCDGLIDEDFISGGISCGIGACQSTGTLECIGYEVSSCQQGLPFPSDSTCDGIDENCNGLIDEQCLSPILLEQGWNLISVPIQTSDKTVKNIFKNITYTNIFTYEDRWYELGANSIINETKGYWINSQKVQTLTVNGSPYSYGAALALNKGWNLIGHPLLAQKNISELYTNVTVLAYNKSEWYTYSSERPAGMNTLSWLKQGYGYWVNLR